MGDNDKRKDELTKQLKSKMEELKKLRKKMTEDQDYGKDYANINKVKKLKSEIKTLKEDKLKKTIRIKKKKMMIKKNKKKTLKQSRR